MRLRVVSPERVLYDADVSGVILETVNGQITVLPKHIPLVGLLKAGEVIVKDNGKTVPLVISGGILEVSNNEAIVMADTAEHVHDLDLGRAQKAVELARKLISEKKYDLREYETLRVNLQKHEVRVSAFRKWRK